MINSFTEAVIYLAARLKKQLPDICVKVDAETASKQLSLEQFIAACEMYLQSGAEFYPNNIQKVIDMVKKPVSNEDVATNIASAIMNAYVDHGYRWNVPTHGHIKREDDVIELGQYFKGKDTNYLQWDHAALSVFGPVGLEIINRYGGWTSFCEIAKDTLDGVIRAQIKTLALSLMNTHERTGSFGLSLSPSGSAPLLSGQNLIEMKIKELK